MVYLTSHFKARIECTSDMKGYSAFWILQGWNMTHMWLIIVLVKTLIFLTRNESMFDWWKCTESRHAWLSLTSNGIQFYFLYCSEVELKHIFGRRLQVRTTSGMNAVRIEGLFIWFTLSSHYLPLNACWSCSQTGSLGTRLVAFLICACVHYSSFSQKETVYVRVRTVNICIKYM